MTEPEKIFVMQCALERIKDSPLTAEEIHNTAQDALALLYWDEGARLGLGDWGKNLLDLMGQMARYTKSFPSEGRFTRDD